MSADIDPKLTKTADGCRPDQLFGLWAIEETQFRELKALALSVDLDNLRAESKAEAAEAASRPLYRTADGIARIDISGPMTKYPTSFQSLFGGTSMLRVRESLRAAARDPEVLGVMLVIDSPGGTAAGTSDLADEIRRTNTKKPVYTFAEDQCCSAALWALTQGRKAFANVGAQVGSLGTYMVIHDTSGKYAAAGIEVHVISSAPPIKGAGVEGSKIQPAQIVDWERRVRDLSDAFAAEVKTSRRLSDEQIKSLATGQVWVASKALELGLIDGVMSLDEAMRQLRSEAMNEQDTKAALDLAANAEKELVAEKAARAAKEAEVVELRDRLAKLEAKDRDERFAKAAIEVGAPKEFAAILDQVEAKAGADVYTAVMSQMRAFAAQVKEGKLFDEKGSSAEDTTGSKSERLLALATAKVKKGDARTLEEAVSAVLKEQPALYEGYVKETEVAV